MNTQKFVYHIAENIVICNNSDSYLGRMHILFLSIPTVIGQYILKRIVCYIHESLGNVNERDVGFLVGMRVTVA